MRDNLVPTVIVDKNNKTTTVYKKSDAGQSSAGLIPSLNGVPLPITSTAARPPFLHSMFPALGRRTERKRREAEVIEDRKKRAFLTSKLHSFTDFAIGGLDDFPTDKLQKMVDILDSTPYDHELNGNYASVLQAVKWQKSSEFEIAYANRDALKAGVRFDFLLMMAGTLNPGEYRINNLDEHIKVDLELRNSGQRVYWKLRNLQVAVNIAPEQFESLTRLGAIAMKNGLNTKPYFDQSDIPQRFLSFIDEWPDREDSILEHYERFGESQFTREVLSQALSTHAAVDEGWL